MSLPSELNRISDNRCFDGRQLRYQHTSSTLNCDMHLSIFLPPQAEHGPVPVLYWLSGLTCTDENFVHKAGAQRAAAAHGVAIVAADTSPRGDSVPDDPGAVYDFGLGAGFYVNAIEAPWSNHYHMYDYCTKELPQLIQQHFPVMADRQGIFGHSMGGHGALTIALKNPAQFRSVSAFAPICSPMECPWGHKALGNYLGEDRDLWSDYDATALIASGAPVIPMKVDQGADDNFLVDQLKPELLQLACQQRAYPLDYQLHPGYDHSYFFIASLIDQHIAFHARHLSSG
jgi:S-formylglutathione hydrolase